MKGDSMLVLSRKRWESIVIGDNIVVTVVALARGRVQIGITAPPQVSVYRQEIVRRMIANGEAVELACCASARENFLSTPHDAGDAPSTTIIAKR
jgi:carbon storage regulator CsrA